jgi:hypothetical protein
VALKAYAESVALTQRIQLIHGQEKEGHRIFDVVLFVISGVKPIMKNPYEVLKKKEQEIERVRREVEALRVIAPLLSDEESEPPAEEKPLRSVRTRTPSEE